MTSMTSGLNSSSVAAPNRASASRQPFSACGAPAIVHVRGVTGSGNTSPTFERV
jgi:hypothetical protein